jgi:hypothetical protein
MKQYIQLYENWQRPQTITLKSPMKGRIVLNIEHGKIHSIKNNTNLEPNFVSGQPVQLPFIKGWAREHGFKVEDSNQLIGDKKIFGINTKYIQKEDPLRRIYPGKFRD